MLCTSSLLQRYCFETSSFRISCSDCTLPSSYSSALVGGVMTLEEITRVNDSQALNSAIETLSPGSVKGGAVLHMKQILKMCLKLNGRDCDKCLFQLSFDTLTWPLLKAGNCYRRNELASW